jgi:uncharacterized phage protein gp47/JayE
MEVWMKTISEIYNDMAAAFTAESGIAVHESGDMALRLYASATEIYSLYVYADWLMRMAFPQTAEGEYLDRHAESRGLKREGAAKAVGSIEFMLSAPLSQDLTVPLGTVCLTATGLRFETTEEGIIPAGETSCTVGARAADTGGAYNVPPGTVIYMALPPVGVSACSNSVAFSGGADRESDEKLRERILSSYKRLPNGANASFYEQEALNIPGVAAVNLFPRARGLGTLDIVAASDSGMPSEPLLEEIRAQLNSLRELCVDICVSAPVAVPVDLSVEIEPGENHTPEETMASVSAALGKFFSGELLGKNVLLAELGQVIFSAKGVKNYRITAPDSDISVQSGELPVMGTLTLSAMGA